MKNICMCHMLLYVLLAAGAAWAVTVEKGVEITLEAATPEEGQAFHHWAGTGAPAGEAAFQSEWTYVPTASGEVEAVYGSLVTVTNGRDLATAVTTAGDYCVVRAGAGQGSAARLDGRFGDRCLRQSARSQPRSRHWCL